MRKAIFSIFFVAILILTPLIPSAQAVFTWDGIQFVYGVDIDYPHPDRGYYGISPSVEWNREGFLLIHSQIPRSTSQAIVDGIMLASGVVALIISINYAGTYSSILVGVIELVIAYYLTQIINEYFLDEYGVIWWWLSLQFCSYIEANAETLAFYMGGNPSLAYSLILGAFSLYGYLRVGQVTFHDGIGAGNPPYLTSLSISISSGGTTTPYPGTYMFSTSESVTVTAIAYAGHTFDYWILDGATAYDNPITVTMDSDHDLTAHFTYVNNPPNIPSKPSGPTSGCIQRLYPYSTTTTDPDGDYVYYQFDWGDGTVSTIGPYLSGDNVSTSHAWSSVGTYDVTVRAKDSYGLWSGGWSPSLRVTIEPTLTTIINDLGFANIEESTAETFGLGVYEMKLYAEFAGYHELNNLSWYSVGTANYNMVFSGSDGGYGYVEPPIIKTFTVDGEFGLSFHSPEARYFTETAKNPDGIKHAQVYVNLDNPNMFLIGFENLLGIQNEDYNDMVVSLEIINKPPNTPSKPSGYTVGSTGTPYSYSTSTTDPDGDNVYYRFDWGDGPATLKGPYSSGITVSASHTWSSAATYDVKVKAKDPNGLWSDWSLSLSVTINGDDGGSGGCPTLFVWNGTAYNDFGVINIHDPENNDIIKEVTLSTECVGINYYTAKIRLREGWEGLTYSHSEIDQVKLYAVIDGNRYLCPLIHASHSELGGITLELLFSDDSKVDTDLLETIDLKFFIPYQNIAEFVFVIEGNNPYKM